MLGLGLGLASVLVFAGDTDITLGAGFGPTRTEPHHAFVSLEGDHWLWNRNVGVLLAADGNTRAYWVGTGLIVGISLGDHFEIQVSSGPGCYPKEDALNLGSVLEFRSSLQVVYKLPAGWRTGMAVSHISNGGISKHNPGAETVRVTLGHTFRPAGH